MNSSQPYSHFRLIRFFCTVLAYLFLSNLSAQTDEPPKQDLRPVRNMFESIWLIDNQTVVVPIKGTFEFDIQHRFGSWENGYSDFIGLAAPSNIRLGFEYVFVDNLMIGFGITKERMLWDFNAKYAIVQQKRSGGFPFSVTYLGLASIDSRDGDLFQEGSDRWSYFNQLMIARKLSEGISLQVAPSLSWFNFLDPILNDEGSYLGRLDQQHFAIAFSGRFKVSSGLAIIANYDAPITNHPVNQPKSNLSFGLEIATSSHAFQVFLGNYKGINPQVNNVLNQNDFGNNQILIGFNMTRLWNF